MAKIRIRNITTDDLGYQGQVFKAGEAVEVSASQAKAMTESLPDRFRMVRKAKNRQVDEDAAENRAVK